ncbi:hypothetical protein G9A89_004462 [Geosiphon pyriformis]|nr:hypothetical protein G9A89_004462 [Geosiphon pyriformis]
MSDYSYLPQQSEKHFAAHNRNNLDFIELNPLPSCLICFPIEKQSSRQFKDFWNWFLNEHSTETYTTYTTYYFDQAYFEDNFEERNNITLLKTKEKSYQTAPIFNLFLSESEHFTQTVTPEPMAQDPMQAYKLLWNKETTPHYLYSELDNFERAATANQYDDEYKFQIVGGYLQGSPTIWFLQETNAGAQQRIVRWTPANIEENNTSFTTQRTQGPSEIVTKYAKAIRKLIKHVDFGRNWTEEQKIYSFTKGLRTDLSYALWPLLALKNNSTMNMVIELAQRIEDNQRIHLGSTLPVFASALIMAPTPQMATTSFAAQTQNPNE